MAWACSSTSVVSNSSKVASTAAQESGLALQVSDASAVFEAGHQVARPTAALRGCRSPAPFPADEVRLEAVGSNANSGARAAKIRLHLVENENDVVLAAEVLQHLR